jgi:hypothetical protein
MSDEKKKATDDQRPCCPRCGVKMLFCEWSNYYDSFTGWAFDCACVDDGDLLPDTKDHYSP